MERKKNMGFTSRKNSFYYAFSGLRSIFKQEPNVRLHALATVAAITAGCFRHITKGEWLAIVVAIGLVWITEALNTCIERLCDFACDNKIDPAIKVIKDIAAGAVLIAATIAVIIAVIVFFF
jgi:diacylglycerol kinase